jgi:hypothetical protein
VRDWSTPKVISNRQRTAFHGDSKQAMRLS